MQRFLSSAMKQWDSIAESYGELHAAFRAENPRCDDNETLQYEMFGSDFVADLLCLLDLLAPVRSLMTLVQDIQLPHWKIMTLWKPVAEFLRVRGECFRREDYPRYDKCADNLRPDGHFAGVELLEGWLVEAAESAGSASASRIRRRPGVVQWRLREQKVS
jgi:hypothetical protein